MLTDKASLSAIFVFSKNLFKFVKKGSPRKGVNEPPYTT